MIPQLLRVAHDLLATQSTNCSSQRVNSAGEQITPTEYPNLSEIKMPKL